MKVFFAAIVIALQSSSCDGFLSLPFVNQANPAVAGFAEAQDSALLKIHLDIGDVDSRLGIDGLMVELRGKEDANYKHPNLPGADGPNPQLSSGAKTMHLVEDGKFIDLTGSRRVILDNGVWEMIWRKNANAGALICGFDVPEEVKRNDAVIPKGRVYVTFPIWTDERLKDLRERKVKAEERAVAAMDRLKDATLKMEQESNLLMKALHFRESMKAHEEIDYSGYRNYQSMKLDKDMVSLKDGLHLCSLGTVWTKDQGFFGADHVLLGSATASAGDRKDLAEKEVVTERLQSVARDSLRP